jgi:hypothetical protein
MESPTRRYAGPGIVRVDRVPAEHMVGWKCVLGQTWSTGVPDVAARVRGVAPARRAEGPDASPARRGRSSNTAAGFIVSPLVLLVVVVGVLGNLWVVGVVLVIVVTRTIATENSDVSPGS